MSPAATVISRPAVSSPNDPAFDLLAQQAQETFGFLMLTIFAWIPERRALKRVWSSDMEKFPNGGEKLMPADAPWPQTVIEQQKPHCSWNEEEIKQTYNDSQSILGNGLGNVLSIPILHEGKTVGALNFSGGPGSYSDHEATLRQIEGLARGAGSACLPYI